MMFVGKLILNDVNKRKTNNMTCIAGLVDGKNVWLAGDRAATGGGLNRILLKHPKIFMKSNIGFGICGSPKIANAIEHVLVMPEHEKGLEPSTYLISRLVPAMRECLQSIDATVEHNGQQYLEGGMLIAFKGELYQLECNFQVTQTANGFDAIGSGGEAALGSLRASRGVGARKRLKMAMETSAENNAGVAPPFDYLLIKGTLYDLCSRSDS